MSASEENLAPEDDETVQGRVGGFRWWLEYSQQVDVFHIQRNSTGRTLMRSLSSLEVIWAEARSDILLAMVKLWFSCLLLSRACSGRSTHLILSFRAVVRLSQGDFAFRRGVIALSVFIVSC